MAFRPHRFGRYTIIDPVAVGGMAEIYRARITGAKDGPDRVIIIKKVIANLSQNTEFIQMFEEEIKITVGFTHPNIIQIYDYGKVDDQHFLAMEYVEGKNLRQFVKRLTEMKSMFSIDMSAYIISQVCHALAYAHNFKDRLTGKHLQIVHRDISPQNVMLSYEGAVKLFDFGIAKAKSASEATRAGVIKGKPSYLSPEQINGEELDGRSDIFALGIVLWELLTAKRLFVAENDMGVLKLIQSAKIEAPSTFNPAVPQALDAIVLKSLVRDRSKRYQSAEDFQRDLHRFLYSFNPAFNPADLSYYAQELFKKEIGEDRERLMKYLAMEPAETEGGGAPAAPKKAASTNTNLAEGLMSSLDFNRDAMESVLSGQTNVPDAKLDTSSIALADLGVKKSGTPSKPSMPFVNKSSVPPPMGKKSGSDQMVIPPWQKQGVGLPTGGTGSRRAGTRAALELEKSMKEGGKPVNSRNILTLSGIFVCALFVLSKQMGWLEGTPFGDDPVAVTSAPPVTRTPAATPPSQTPTNLAQPTPPQAASVGTVILQSNVEGYRVSVNGLPMRMENHQFSVPINTPLVIRVDRYGYQPIQFQASVPDAKPIAFKVDLKALPSGVLIFTTVPESKLTLVPIGRDPASGFVGEPLTLQTPVKNHSIPAGRYRVQIENSLIGFSSSVEIVIEKDKVTRVEKVLQ